MRKIFAVGICGIALLVSVLRSQSLSEDEKKKLDEFMRQLKQEYSLTDEQVSQIKTMFEKMFIVMKQEYERVREARRQARKRIQAEWQNTRKNISGVLTQEQKQKFEQNKGKIVELLRKSLREKEEEQE